MLSIFTHIALSILIFTSTVNASESALPLESQSAFTDRVQSVCCTIRNIDDPDAELAAKHELLALLTSTETATLSKIEEQLYVRAAYGLFLCEPRLDARTVALQKLQQFANPVVLNENLVYMQMPSGQLVVLEKLTAVNQPAWLQYATAEYTPYIRLGDFKALREDMEEGPEKESLMWIEFRHDKSGISYFLSRIEAGIKDSYDKWIAYLYGNSIETLLRERQNTDVITPDYIEMVMTIQSSAQHSTYSPMGISRTVAAAKKMLAEKTAGRVVEKIKPSLSIWFHALTCKLVQTKYPHVNKFWTTPVLSMRKILIKALLVDMPLPLLSETGLVWGKFFAQEPQKGMLARKILENRFTGLPWSNETEFGRNGSSTEISAKNLLSTILP